MLAPNATQVAQQIVANVSRALQGKEDRVELAVVALLARGHVLIEDVPGVGKTTLARSLAQSIAVSYRRVQFTSDILPADVLGGNVYNQSTGSFTFRPGPVFTHVLLADEINRTPPKTQSALLEAMAERRVSIDGETRVLEEPFFVVATQNPREFFGTYPLPESELDRFLVRIELGYPPQDTERALIAAQRNPAAHADLQAVVERQALLMAQDAVDDVSMQDNVIDYLHAIIRATRSTPLLELGASTRGALALSRAVRAYALIKGRNYVLPDDVKRLAPAVLPHRIRLAGFQDSMPSRSDAIAVIDDLMSHIPVPL
ncbi:MAG: MoxR family ATPase [Myxococcales bacterium]|nr:MAG: MoxR family ATPase [Myxococcales bacterium]